MRRHRRWTTVLGLVAACWLLLSASGRTANESLPCAGGMAGPYPCENVDLLSHLSIDELSPPSTPPENRWASDLWGWVDPVSGAEYALVGVEHGVSVVDVTDPAAALVAGFIPATVIEDPRGRVHDLKVYQNHAFIVSEINDHGLQVIDLTALPEVEQVAWYQSFGRAHNIAIDEASGYAYVSGSNTCSGGLHIVDIRVPSSPTFVGCYADHGYSHDAHCLTYPAGSAYPDREICFNFTGNEIAVLDVTDKSSIQLLADVTYTGHEYVHQGWTTGDRQYLFQDDEFDEYQNGINTTTYIWDISELSQPQLVSSFTSSTPSTDHNLYIRGDHVYEANYSAGMRILDIADPLQPCEVGYFDLLPEHDNPGFFGAWTAYPFLSSGTLLLSGRQQGLFVLRADDLPGCNALPAASFLPLVLR